MPTKLVPQQGNLLGFKFEAVGKVLGEVPVQGQLACVQEKEHMQVLGGHMRRARRNAKRNERNGRSARPYPRLAGLNPACVQTVLCEKIQSLLSQSLAGVKPRTERIELVGISH